MHTLETSRAELHALVWSKPAKDCAEQLGMSNTELAKLCRRNDVIRPPNGYWLRKHQYKEPPPLRGKDRRIAVRLPDEQSSTAKLEIKIPKVPFGRRMHNELTRVRSTLTDARTDNFGRLKSERTDVQVSRKSLPRALKLLNVIVCTALELDCNVATPKNGIELSRGEVSMTLHIFESSKQSAGRVSNLGGHKYVERIYTPSGQLKFSLYGAYSAGEQSEWNDRPNNPLESQIDSIMLAILRGFDRLEIRQIEQQRQQRQVAFRLLREKRLELAKKLLIERQQRIHRLIDEWHRSKHITEVMDELESQGAAASPKNRRTIRWARDLARHYDPLDSFTIDALSD